MRKQEKNYSKSKITNLFKTLILVTGFILAFNLNSAAQTYPNVYQEWTRVAENEKEMVEVSVMFAKCSSAASDSVYIMVFNEKPVKDTVELELTIYNEDKSKNTKKSITLYMSVAQMIVPQCGENAWRNLVFPLPSNYDPKKSTLAVKFK